MDEYPIAFNSLMVKLNTYYDLFLNEEHEEIKGYLKGIVYYILGEIKDLYDDQKVFK